MKKVHFLSLCFLLLLSAMAETADLTGKTVRYIRIDSDFSIDRRSILHALTIQEGKPLSKSDIRTSLRNLHNLQRYRQITVMGEPFMDGVAVTISVVPEWTIRKIGYKGRKTSFLFAYGLGSRVSKKDISRAVVLKENQIFTQKNLELSMKGLSDLYASFGYCTSHTHAETRFDPETHEIDIEFNIDKGSATKIRKVEFEGNLGIDTEKLLSRMRSKPGRRYLAGSLESDIERLQDYYLKKDYYTSRVFRPETIYDKSTNTYDIKIRIDEGLSEEIRIDAPLKLWNLKWWIYRYEPKPITLLDILGLENVDQIDEQNLQSAANNLNGHFQAHGYAFSTAEIARTAREDGKTVLQFSVQPGRKVIIESFQIQGNSYYNSDYLLKSIISKSKRPYRADTFKGDIESIRLLYQQNGFKNVRVEGSEIVRNYETNEVTLRISIEEGRRYQISSIRITGQTIASLDELSSIALIKTGDPFYQSAIDNGIAEIRKYYESKGYSEVRIIPDISVDDETGQAELALKIEEGGAAIIQKALVRGYKKTRWDLIRRKIAYLDGHPYDMRTLISAQQEVSKLGLFSSVRIFNPPSDHGSTRRTVIFDVAERSSVFLETGPGYNTDFGLNGYLNLYTINLYGTNRYLGGSYYISQKTEKIQTIYREPEFAGYPVQMELRFFRNFSEEDNYDLYRHGGRINWTYRWSSKLRGVLEYRLDEDNPTNVQEGFVLPDEYLNSLRIGSLAPSLLYDTRDDARNPTQGSLLSYRVEFARPVYSSEVDFTKMTVETIRFIPISKDQVLGLAFRAGWGRDLPLTERFKLGGIKTIRGWGFEDIQGESTDTLYPPGGKPILRGGNFMLLGNIEWRVDLVFGLQGVIFYDTGNIWDDRSEITLKDLKGTAGLGIRFMTPIGPVGLDYGYNVQRDSDDPQQRWSFIIGHAF